MTDIKPGTLKVDPQYQRGNAWTRSQQKMFIDSIMRGYPIPVIFLHQNEEKVPVFMEEEEHTNINYEIIDGQQRINALREYVKGEYKLIDPSDKKDTTFPNFSQATNIPWAGKGFEQLNEQLRDKLLGKVIPVILIKHEENSVNEARDLFIRLQAGSALNDQEKRDAWPGEFTGFIFKSGIIQPL